MVSIPSPPTNFTVSVRRSSLYPPCALSAPRSSCVARATVPAAVKRPCASTVNVGIAVDDPYEPAVTAVSLSLRVVVPAVSLYVDVNAVPASTDAPIISWTTSVDPDIGIHGPSGADSPL